MTTLQQEQHDRRVALWLVFCAAVVFGMIVLGGVTRLTHSGLSMVDWRPLMGVIPPMSEAAWLDKLEQYRQYPEYQQINRGMDLDAFKRIFMYEYLHRVLGRVIGVIFFFPLLYFALRGRIRSGMMPHLIALFCLGALQGLLGWYMVKSGLVNEPRVSQYRLTAHLGVAFLIYAYMLWLVFELVFLREQRQPRRHPNALAPWSLVLTGLIFLMILTGGLVAGTKAGFAYPTWPLMGDSFIPPGLYTTSPAWLAAFEDITTIQFNHRIFAYVLFVVITSYVVFVFRSRAGKRVRVAAALLAGALLLQMTLGITTLLTHVALPLAAAHQGGAVVLLSAALYLSHVMLRQQRQD